MATYVFDVKYPDVPTLVQRSSVEVPFVSAGFTVQCEVKKRPRKASAIDALRDAIDLVGSAKCVCEELAGEMTEWRDNLPENLQGTEKYEALESAASTLEEQQGELEDVESEIEALVERAEALDHKPAKTFDYFIRVNVSKKNVRRDAVESLIKRFVPDPSTVSAVRKVTHATSRADRAGEAQADCMNAFEALELAESCVRDLPSGDPEDGEYEASTVLADEISELAQRVSSAADEIGNVEFPGMY